MSATPYTDAELDAFTGYEGAILDHALVEYRRLVNPPLTHEDLAKMDPGAPMEVESVYLTGRRLLATVAALRQQRDEAKSRSDFADELLKRVVIQGGAGKWTESEMRDWCCDYKDHRLGYPPKWIREQGHKNCAHRARGQQP